MLQFLSRAALPQTCSQKRGEQLRASLDLTPQSEEEGTPATGCRSSCMLLVQWANKELLVPICTPIRAQFCLLHTEVSLIKNRCSSLISWDGHHPEVYKCGGIHSFFQAILC